LVSNKRIKIKEKNNRLSYNTMIEKFPYLLKVEKLNDNSLSQEFFLDFLYSYICVIIP